MAQFDIITASTKSYKTCWQARPYLLKLALPPFLIKVACLVFAAAFAEKGETVSFLFFMLPALFAEGWMLSHFVRYLQLGQTWPFCPTGDFDADMGMLSVRARGVLGGMIVYVLIGMALGVITLFAQQLLTPYLSEDALKDPEAIPAYIGVGSLFALAVMFWGFRLVWIFIPYALNGDAGTYLYRLRGLGTSLHMIGVWVICLLPFLLILQIGASVVDAVLGTGPVGYFVITILVAAVDTAKAFTTTAGITFGIREVFERQEAR
jgi:hypothetical protein